MTACGERGAVVVEEREGAATTVMRGSQGDGEECVNQLVYVMMLVLFYFQYLLQFIFICVRFEKNKKNATWLKTQEFSGIHRKNLGSRLVASVVGAAVQRKRMLSRGAKHPLNWPVPCMN